jgi:hypothetical protein
VKWAAALAALLLSACSTRARHPAAAHIDRCDFELRLAARGTVAVDASCQASGDFVLQAPKSMKAGLRGLPERRSGRYRAERGRLSYVVDLRRLAGRGRKNFDRAARFGDSYVAPLSNVLLVPAPLTTEIPVTVHVSAEPGVQVAVGLKRAAAPDTYQLMAHEIPVATYFAFGKLEQRLLELPGGKLEIAKLEGALDQSTPDITRWIDASARAVSDFYRTFPVPRASVTVMPIPGRRSVLFGKVLPESEPGVALLIGEHAPRKALYSDWILVHELFHLGFPSFNGEGKWLDEGLATYYEPIIRVRAGLYTESEMWSELEESMPQGLPAFTEGGLEKADDFRGIYWGGAMACLVADVEARKNHLDRGLETGLRALRDMGGVASEVWALDDAIDVIDRAFDRPILKKIRREHAAHGSPFDFRGLLRDLGVSRNASGGIVLSDQAPLAAVRRAIVHGS